MTTPERRLELRKSADIRAVVMAGGFEMGARIVDQSPGGLKIVLDRAMALKGPVTVVDIARGVAIKAEAVWAKGAEAGVKKRSEASLRGLTPSRLAEARAAWLRAGGR